MTFQDYFKKMYVKSDDISRKNVKNFCAVKVNKIFVYTV